jgi:hypothetical protein
MKRIHETNDIEVFESDDLNDRIKLLESLVSISDCENPQVVFNTLNVRTVEPEPVKPPETNVMKVVVTNFVSSFILSFLLVMVAFIAIIVVAHMGWY